MHSTIAELNGKISYVMAENVGFRQHLSGSVPVVNDIFGNVEGVPDMLAFVGDRFYNQNRGRVLRVGKYSNLSCEKSDTLNLLICEEIHRKWADNFDAYSDASWSRELGRSSKLYEKRVFWEEFGHDYASFLKELGVLRTRADRARSKEEAFDGHMAIGRVLYEHQLFKEALVSFKRACELQPTEVRPHFRARNCWYVLGKYKEAKEEFLLALEATEAGENQWGYLLLFFVLHILEP
ncbi:putative TPR repeat-containing protein, partial [Cucurbita argyrosperma subsp. sororia]